MRHPLILRNLPRRTVTFLDGDIRATAAGAASMGTSTDHVR